MDVDFAQATHGICDDQWFHCLSTGEGWLQNFDWFAVDAHSAFACFE
jgi:hypothetical protein